jgi:hypothetical protein
MTVSCRARRHEQGLTPCALKLANLLIDTTGEPHVADLPQSCAPSTGSPCGKLHVGIEGEPGDPVILDIDCHEGRRHLPIVRVNRGA